jgi:tripartite-type tricarboxylate transporter receptor subunit TctC
MYVSPFLQKVPYHPVNDFKQIMQFGSFNAGLIVYADSPFKSFQDVVAHARRNPKKLTFGAVAIGLNMTIMKKIAEKEGIEFAPMPFGSAGQAEMALLGKHIDMVAGDFNTVFIESGQTRLLAIFRDERSDEYPQTPILKELGYNIPCRLYMGVLGPKGMPESAVKKIEDSFTKAMKEPDFIKGMKELRLPIFYRNSKELDEYVASSYEIYKEFLK